MSLRGNNDCNVDCAMVVVHGQFLRLSSSVDAVRARTQLPSKEDPPELDSGRADAHGFF